MNTKVFLLSVVSVLLLTVAIVSYKIARQEKAEREFAEEQNNRIINEYVKDLHSGMDSDMGIVSPSRTLYHGQSLQELMDSKDFEHTPCLNLTLPPPHDRMNAEPNWADMLIEDFRRIDKAFCNLPGGIARTWVIPKENVK